MTAQSKPGSHALKGVVDHFSAANVVLRCQPGRGTPPGRPDIDDHFADVQRVRSGQSPVLYAASTPPTNSAGIDDLRTLGATVFRAHIAGDSGTLRALSATTSRVDLLNGLMISAETLAHWVATQRECSALEVAESLHYAAVGMFLGKGNPDDND